jgi:hypothetical protein
MTKWLMAVVLSGIIVTSCAATYPYKFYALWLEDNVLAGPEPKDDLSLDVCQPKGACVVYLLEEHRRVRADFLKLQNEYNSLRRKCGARCR